MKLKINPTHKVILNNHQTCNFVVIGCGGNGSFLIRDLARLIAIKNQDLLIENKYNNMHLLTVIDGDNVENKNIRRQNFIPADVGKNKAEVLSERYSKAYGLDVSYLGKYIKSSKELADMVRSKPQIPILIGCVDNNATRSLIAQTMASLSFEGKRAYWLDGGNEEFSGQVVLGNTMGRLNWQNEPENYITKDMPQIKRKSLGIPVATQAFPEILEVTDKRPDQMSCDDRAVSSPQCIATNITVATIMINFCNHFINMPNEGIESWIVNFNVKKINFNTMFNTYENHKEASKNPIYVQPKLNIEAKPID